MVYKILTAKCFLPYWLAIFHVVCSRLIYIYIYIYIVICMCVFIVSCNSFGLSFVHAVKVLRVFSSKIRGECNERKAFVGEINPVAPNFKPLFCGGYKIKNENIRSKTFAEGSSRAYGRCQVLWQGFFLCMMYISFSFQKYNLL